MKAASGAIRKYEEAIAFARLLPRQMVHSFCDMPSVAGVSEATARRRVDELAKVGLAERLNDSFMVRIDAVCYPIEVLETMLPSLLAHVQARRFARRKNGSDLTFARRHLPHGSFVTLDYPLARLTGYQTAWDYHVCVDDQEAFVSLLEENGFREDDLGRVVVMPKIGKFDNEKERLVLDCLADGGRSYCDAIALLMLHIKSSPVHATFSTNEINDVLRNLPDTRAYPSSMVAHELHPAGGTRNFQGLRVGHIRRGSSGDTARGR